MCVCVCVCVVEKMSASSVSAALQDALEKGDVVELEQAIVAAENALNVASRSRKASSSLGNLIARAKDMYLVHMEACRPYVKPLRKACKELNERGIFEALVRARGAPDEVQLCMYTDLCNAESLRHEIVEAQKVAVQLLDATSSDDIDNFLNECSPFLEDRTILSLVQKREDLLREEKRRQAGRMTPLRGASRGGGGNGGSMQRSRCDPLENLGRYEVEDEGMSPVNGAASLRATMTPLRPATTGSASRHLLESGRRVGTPRENVSPRSSARAPAVYPVIRSAIDAARDAGLQRAVEAGTSPWMQAVRSLRLQAYEEVAREERESRRHLEEGEIENRAQLYRAEMLQRVQCWVDTAGVFRNNSENDSCDGSEEEGKAQEVEKQQRGSDLSGAPPTGLKSDASWVRLPAPPPLPTAATVSAAAAGPSSVSAAGSSSGARAGNTPTRVYAHSLAAFPLRASSSTQKQQQPLIPTLATTRTRRSDTAERAAEGAILGSAVRARLAGASQPSSPAAHTIAAAVAAATSVAQRTPRMSRDTPNISPIKETSTASGIGSMWEQDAMYHRGETRPGWGDKSERDATPRHRDSAGSAATTASTIASSMAAPPTLELRRIQARLRAVLQEEDIHRRDIEGTEDFDRSVFLFPVSARIAMLRRTAADRLRML